MPDHIHDSELISIDEISFRYATRRRFSAYLVVVTCDTNGQIVTYTTPQTYPVLHRPAAGKPAKLEFGFDGFPIHSSTTKVPDLVRYDVFMVRDRKAARKAGDILKEIGSSKALQAATKVAETALLAATGPAGPIVAAVAAAIGPVLELVGGILEKVEDKVIESCSGSKVFDAATLAKDELTETIVSSTGNIATKVDIMLFDSHKDIDDVDDLRGGVVVFGREDLERIDAKLEGLGRQARKVGALGLML